MHVLAQSAPSFFRCTLILGVIGNNSTFVYGVFLVGFVVSLTILEGAPSIANGPQSGLSNMQLYFFQAPKF